MLKIGGKNYKGMYRGEQEIKKAYLGDLLVFSAESPSGWPNGYTEVEYVTTDNYSRVEISGVRLTTNTTRIVMDITPQEKVPYYRYLFVGLRVVGTVGYSTQFRQDNAANRMFAMSGWDGSGSTKTFTYNMVSGNRITVDFDTILKKVKMGTSSFSINVASATADTGELRLGGIVNYSSSFAALAMRIHSCQVYVDGEQKADLVPCVRKEDGRAGMYNLVDDTFCTYTYGTLTPGPAV